jgi:acetyl esterase
MGALHPDMQAMLDRRAALNLPGFAEGTIADARRTFADSQAALPKGRGTNVARTEDILIPGPRGDVAARRYVPFDRSGDGVILYFHGGGWVFGTLDGFDPVCRQLAAASGLEVVSVDYGLAPEHPFPGPLDDAWAALLALAQDERPTIVMGDSAGGNLAAALALRARDRGGPDIAMQVLLYPVLSPDFDRESYRLYGAGQHFITRADMMWFWDHHVAEGRRQDPEASPLAAKRHDGLPEAIIVLGECDPLHDEGVAYAEALRGAGVAVTLRQHRGMAHGFCTLVDLLPAANAEIDALGALIARR